MHVQKFEIPLFFVTVMTICFSRIDTLAWSVPRHGIFTSRAIKRTRVFLSRSNDNSETKETDQRSLSELLSPNPKCNPTQMSPTALAYIGDSVYELFVRSRYVWPTRRTTDLQKLVVGKVRAETQSKILRNLMSSLEWNFTSEEETILSRGRNAGSSSGVRKRGPKRLYSNTDGKENEKSGPAVYQDSTAIEAVIGYVYLTNKERCAELMDIICSELDRMDDIEGVIR